MGARLVHQLSDCGLTVRAEGNALVVGPRNLITDPLRQFIRGHKTELLAELSAANDHKHEQAVEKHVEPVLCTDCQHYRFGYDHMGNVARCMSAGGVLGELIYRPERRRECAKFIIYQGNEE